MTVTSAAQPVAHPTGHTFVCYARHDEAFVLDVARALHQRGIRLWIDQWHISAGDDWGRAIDAALAGCETFLIVLSPEAVASDEVRGELRVAFDSRKRIVPLLHRPCELPGRLRLTQLIDFTSFTENRQELLDRLVYELRGDRARHLLIPTPFQERKTRRTLLEDVHAEARDRLRFLDADRTILLRLEEQPHQVARAWDEEGGIPLPPRRLPPVTNVLDVFDRETVGGSLAILGAPGSGKTTVLLQLLNVLAGRALDEAQRPVPVLLGLASWKAEKPIARWLVEQLTIKHGVRADYGSRWRDQRQFALLLDGLDEVAPELQQPCVEAINEFRRVHRPPHLVVCCRLAEYENFAVKLQLGSAVCVLPLDDDQIRQYVDRAGRPELWDALHADPALIEMAQSPLLLSFMSELPPDSRGARLLDAPATERRRRLFDVYLNWRLSGTASPPPYSREETRRWLGHLAALLKRQRLSGFLLERMQPDWLSSPIQKWCFGAGVFVCGAAVAALVLGLLDLVFDQIEPGAVGRRLRESVLTGVAVQDASINLTAKLLMFGTVGALIASRRRIWPIETLTWSWPRALSHMQEWAGTAAWVALDYCFSLGTLIGVVAHFILFSRADAVWTIQRTASLTGAIGGVVAVTFLAFVRPTTWLKPSARPTRRPRIVPALVAGALTLALSLGTSAIANAAQLLVAVATSVALSVGLIAIVGLSRLSDRRATSLAQAMLVGAIGGAIVTAMSALAVVRVPMLPWAAAWTSGGAALALTAALTVALLERIRPPKLSDRAPASQPLVRVWARTLVVAIVVGLVLGAAAVTFGRLVGQEVLRDAAVFLTYFDAGFQVMLLFALMGAVSFAVAGASTAALLAGLVGFLSGATGADIERRLVPNQGIRQSARNILVFAALGTVIVGLPYGVLNLFAGVVATWARPSAADWWRLAVAPGVAFGLLAGLLPGAAVIQHVVLRLVLWSSGVVPLRYVRFLNFATERRLLQRVGGRYRFIHVLLRDHLGTSAR